MTPPGPNVEKPEGIESLIAALGDPTAREGAVEALGELGDPLAVGPLRGALHASAAATWHRTVIEALAKIATPEAADAIRDALPEVDPQAVLAGAQALTRIGETFEVDPLIDATSEMHGREGSGFRRQALQALAETNAPEAIRHIVAQMVDSALSEKDRQANGKALARSADPSLVVSALLAAIDGPSSGGEGEVRPKAGLAAASWVLNDVLTRQADALSDEQLRAITELDDRTGVVYESRYDSYEDTYETREYTRPVNFRKLRQQAEAQLARRRGETVVATGDDVDELRERGDLSALVRASLSKRKTVRRRALSAMSEIDLTPALSDDDVKVRLVAASHLGMNGDAGAVGPLTDALADPEPRVRAEAAEALGHLASFGRVTAFPPPTIEALSALLSDDAERVREQAKLSLENLGAGE